MEAIEFSQFPGEDSEGPAIGDDMVHNDQKHMHPRAKCQEHHAQKGSLLQVKRQKRLGACLPFHLDLLFPGTEPTQVPNVYGQGG